MNIHVLYLGQIRHAAGKSAERVALTGPSTMEALIRHLAASGNPQLRRLLLDDAGNVQPGLLLFVEDDQADLSRSLRQGDVVTVLSPMAGG
jgi:molybdopterin converting factor small subunit